MGDREEMEDTELVEMEMERLLEEMESPAEEFPMIHTHLDTVATEPEMDPEDPDG